MPGTSSPTPLSFSFDDVLDLSQLRPNLSLPELQTWNLGCPRCTLGRFSAICILLVACASGVNHTVNRISAKGQVLTMRTHRRTSLAPGGLKGGCACYRSELLVCTQCGKALVVWFGRLEVHLMRRRGRVRRRTVSRRGHGSRGTKGQYEL